MGLPVTVYRSTDPGAPQLTNGTPSEWMDILKKVLVTGYGTKAPLGWTLEFENAGAYKVAFRNNLADGGSGGYVQFWSATGSNAANTAINMKVAAGMVALDSFIKPGAGRQLYTNPVRNWEIIGTSRGFYIIGHLAPLTIGLGSTSSSWPNQYFIGDIESFTPNDAAPFTIVSTINLSGDTYNSTSTGICANVNDVYAYLYDSDGGASGYIYTASKMFPSSSAAFDGNAESSGINQQMLPLVLLIGSVTDAIASNSSLGRPVARGRIPGLFASSFAGYRTENWPKDIIQDSVTWTLLRSYVATRFWVKTGTWYD